MKTLSVRIPESIHIRVRELTKREGISINQLINSALVEKLSALMAEEYMEERAKRGSRKKFEKALAKVKEKSPPPEEKPPRPEDELDS